MVRRIDDLRNAKGKSLQRAAASRDPEADLLELLKGMWSWREELNRQPVVYKLDPTKSDTTQDELTQGKTEEPEEPSS